MRKKNLPFNDGRRSGNSSNAPEQVLMLAEYELEELERHLKQLELKGH
jgi:hypothetical protein